MSRQEANDNFAVKKLAAENAWKAVRANRNDLALDEVLRVKAQQADEAYKEAYRLCTKYAPAV